ncbi:MAG: hypothetical protein IPK80_27645 [Nannocystis sp.]|nr:hypothetical protein [Nannocystis sp.]
MAWWSSMPLPPSAAMLTIALGTSGVTEGWPPKTTVAPSSTMVWMKVTTKGAR